MKKRNRKNLTVSTKLNLIIILIIFTLGIFTMGIAYYTIKSSNLKDMNNALHDSALIIAQSTNKEKILSALGQPNDQNPDVRDLTKEMDYINQHSSVITNLNLISKVNGKYHAPVLSSSILDAGVSYDSELESIGISKKYISKIDQVFKSKKVLATEIYGDQYGQYKTGLAPLLDDDGNVIAVYAVDYDVSSVKSKALEEALKVFYMTIVFLIISSIFVRFFVAKYFKPINSLSEASKKVAEGNLDIEPIEVKSKDEIGILTENFNSMIDHLRTIIISVKKAASEVETSSTSLSNNMNGVRGLTNQIVGSMQEIASGTDSQVDHTGQTTRIIEEMSLGIQRITESAAIISENAIHSSDDAAKGNKVTEKTVQQMTLINQTVHQSANLVQSLNKHSEQIQGIVKIITDIATQTNLLALNAAIEASRAGEHGRGFAVVADEVRKLAEQSSESTRQISEILTKVQTLTSETVLTMENAVQEVNQGILHVNESDSSFAQILDSIRLVSEQIQEITATFEEITAGSEEVTQSVQIMENISKKSRDNTKEVADSSLSQLDIIEDMTEESYELKRLSDRLQTTVEKFTVNEGDK
ncbi:methyl-accepting chemotaxis protein [Bacillus sp. 1P06AnD]|uniref:methyl-accepting chemotaxis protein n=1 Tax=Bacillus sp. 1P06AnD TaxID=3132208 RepID=UPI0039A089C2